MSEVKQGAIEVFYSYAQEDEALCIELNKHLNLLQRQGLIRGWQRRSVTAGSEYAREIDAHFTAAQIILLLVSTDYLVSDYCYGVEMERAMQRQNAGEARVIPIILRPVDWEQAPFGRLQALPTDGKPVTTWAASPPYDAAFHNIAKGLRQVLEEQYQRKARLSDLPAQTSAPGTPISNLPYLRNPYFTGREELLHQLHTNLTRNKSAALTQAQAIHGLGGIGKTQTAIEYAYRHQDEYRFILWVNAATLDTLLASFTDLASALKLPERAEKDQRVVVAAVNAWFASHDGWLAIFDNADDLTLVEDYLPHGGKGHLLLTTRAQAPGTLARGLPVEKMDTQEGSLLLLRRAGILGEDASIEQATPADRQAAEAILRELDGLPLALDQAGAYIEETQCSMASYLEQYSQRQSYFLQRRGGMGKLRHEPVATTWSLSFQQVETLNPLAAELLRCCAFLAPDAIPEQLLVKGASELGPVIAPLDDDASLLDEAVATLARYSLVKRDRNEHTLSVHRLVQTILRTSQDEPAQREWAERTVRAVNKAFPDVKDYRNWPLIRLFLPHAQACADWIDRWEFAFQEAGRLCNQVGYYLWQHARYAEAEAFYKRAIAIGEKTLGPEHPTLAIRLNNLAILYNEQGQYAQAEPLFQRAIAIDEKMLGPEHPNLATDLNNLANNYHKQGQFARAESLFQRAIAIDEKVLGPEHPDLAIDLNNLALLYKQQGQYSQAEPLYLRGIAIDEKALGSEHPNLATRFNNLAIFYEQQGKYERVEPLYLRAIAIREKVFGPEHPFTMRVRENYADFLRKRDEEGQG